MRARGSMYSPHTAISVPPACFRRSGMIHVSQVARLVTSTGTTASTARGPWAAMLAPIAACASDVASAASAEPLHACAWWHPVLRGRSVATVGMFGSV